MVAPFPVLCDLDGVVWLSGVPIPGSVDAIRRLREAGHRVLFVTNNSFSEVGDQEAALGRLGIPAVGDVLTSSMAAALLVSPDERVMVCGGPGIVEAIAARGALAVNVPPYDAVIVGFHRDFDYEVMRKASDAVRAGARLIATNDDATYPTPDGPIPGGGSIVAGIATASEVDAVVAGKPFEPMAGLVRRITGIDDLSEAVMVGDRPSTDGLMALTLGCRYAHVWSGVTAPGVRISPSPWIEGADLASIADRVLA